MSPEMLQRKHYDSRSDIWSVGNSCYMHRLLFANYLGVIYYQLLHDRNYPYYATSIFSLLQVQKEQPIKFRSGISIHSLDFIKKCLTYDYKERMNWDSLFMHPLFNTNLYI